MSEGYKIKIKFKGFKTNNPIKDNIEKLGSGAKKIGSAGFMAVKGHLENNGQRMIDASLEQFDDFGPFGPTRRKRR